MTTNTVTLHRILATSPGKVFRAFTDGDAYASWIAPNGFFARVHTFHMTEGGSYHMSFVNLTTGKSHSFGGEFLSVKPDKEIIYSDRFDDPNLPGEMKTTVRLKSVTMGTELQIVQEGIPSQIPVDMCYLGWQESLDKLKRLVEPHIPDA